MSEATDRAAPVTLKSRVLGLERLSESLLQVIEPSTVTDEALVALARKERLPLMRMNDVLTYAIAMGKVQERGPRIAAATRPRLLHAGESE